LIATRNRGGSEALADESACPTFLLKGLRLERQVKGPDPQKHRLLSEVDLDGEGGAGVCLDGEFERLLRRDEFGRRNAEVDLDYSGH